MNLEKEENKRVKDYVAQEVQSIKNLNIHTPIDEGKVITFKN